MGIAATGSDYAWVNVFHNGLLQFRYCWALVREVSPDEAASRVAANLDTEGLDLDTLMERSLAIQIDSEFRSSLVGVAEVGDWTLLFECNGFLGTTRAIAEPLSQRTVLVSHFRNVNAVGRFLWLEDGETHLTFDPLFPTEREGTMAESVAPMMRDVGFDVDARPTRLPSGSVASSFALAERVTDVAVTAELLAGTEFSGVIAQVPR